MYLTAICIICINCKQKKTTKGIWNLLYEIIAVKGKNNLISTYF